MEAHVRSGPATVIASGFATTFAGNDLEITIASVAFEWSMVVRFLFRADASVKEVAVHSETDEDLLELTLVNFDTDAGRGTAEPVLLCRIGSQVVFLHFKAFRFGRTLEHTLQYTLYAVEADDVGFRLQQENTE